MSVLPRGLFLLFFTLNVKVNFGYIFSKHMRLAIFTVSLEVFAHEDFLELVKHQFILGDRYHKYFQLIYRQILIFFDDTIYQYSEILVDTEKLCLQDIVKFVEYLEFFTIVPSHCLSCIVEWHQDSVKLVYQSK